MKKNHQASILLWSIFLVTFISFSFLYISQSISNKIDLNKERTFLYLSKVMFDMFDETKKTQVSLGNESYEMQFFEGFKTLLKTSQEIEFHFLASNTGSIILQTGGPVYFKIYTGSTVSYSGIVLDQVYDFSIPSDRKLHIQNLGGSASVIFEFESNSGVVYPYNYINVKQSVGGNDIFKKVIVR